MNNPISVPIHNFPFVIKIPVTAQPPHPTLSLGGARVFFLSLRRERTKVRVAEVRSSYKFTISRQNRIHHIRYDLCNRR